jgi:xanthine dehydrogenase accessory factor
MATVIVRGTGDVGSAVAHLLYRAGYTVVLQDTPRPAYPRRGMSFTDAFFDGSAELDGVLAKRARDLGDLSPMVRCRRAIPVVDEPFERVVAALRPQVVIDARMRKREQPEFQRGVAPLTIGLGPSFVAGENVDLVVETAWGGRMGEVIRWGASLALSGDPKPIGGHGRDRFVYAACAGKFRSALKIGDHVEAGAVVGRIGAHDVRAPLTGCLRGLVQDGIEVPSGAKIVEVDPRGDRDGVKGLGERPKRIADGVRRAIEERLPQLDGDCTAG